MGKLLSLVSLLVGVSSVSGAESAYTQEGFQLECTSEAEVNGVFSCYRPFVLVVENHQYVKYFVAFPDQFATYGGDQSMNGIHANTSAEALCALLGRSESPDHSISADDLSGPDLKQVSCGLAAVANEKSVFLHRGCASLESWLKGGNAIPDAIVGMKTCGPKLGFWPKLF